MKMMRKREINHYNVFANIKPRKRCQRIGMTALHLAVENSSSEIVRILLSNAEINVNIKLDTFMDYVEKTPHHHLSAAKPKIRTKITALHLAVENNNLEIMGTDY